MNLDNREELEQVKDVVKVCNDYNDFIDREMDKILSDMKKEFPMIEGTDIFFFYFYNFFKYFLKYICEQIDKTCELYETNDIRKEEAQILLENATMLFSAFGAIFSLHVVVCQHMTPRFCERSKKTRNELLLAFDTREGEHKSTEKMRGFYDYLQMIIYNEIINREKDQDYLNKLLMTEILRCDSEKIMKKENSTLDQMLMDTVHWRYDFLFYERFRTPKKSIDAGKLLRIQKEMQKAVKKK